MLQITTTFTKKRHFRRQEEESEESIENLLYYQDCKHKMQTTSAPAPEKLVEQRQPECPCPKMCCSMCCDCGNNSPQSFMSRQSFPMQLQSPILEPMSRNIPPMIQPIPHQHFQPTMVQRGKKKKFKPGPGGIGPNGAPMVPLGARRGGFTRESIKSLIAQDSDIKQILKNLVRVTMTKVDQKGPAKAPGGPPGGPPGLTRRNIEIPNMSEEEEE